MMKHALLATCAVVVSFGAQAATAGTITYDDYTGVKTGWQMASDDAYLGSRAGCFESLVRVGYDTALEPGLAESWTQTSPKVWEFKLRKGVKFQNGEPLNAAAAVNALTNLLKAPVPARAFSPKLIAAVDAGGDDIVKITTIEPSVLLPAQMASPATSILAPSAYKDGKVDPIGTCTGPFKITKVDANQYMELTANHDYWNGMPKLSGGRVNFIPDADTRATQIRSGEVQISRVIPPWAVKTIEATKGVKVAPITVPRITEMLLNNSKPPFKDIKVRQAIRAAIDTAGIADSIYEGVVKPATMPFAPGEPWAPQDVTPAYDVEKAKALLKEAGIAPGSLKLTLLAYTERTELKDVAAVIQAQLQEIGIKVDVRVADYTAIEPDLLAGNFDMVLLSRGYATDVAEPIGFLNADYTCGGGYNISHYCSEETDKLIKSAYAAAEPAKRYAIYAEAAKRVYDEAVTVYLIHETAFDAYSDKVENFKPHPINYFIMTKDLAVK
ncbi:MULTISPECIES: ABC transporter substrate-binding protein [Agrobacterium tumefaciens complex]|jgi:peptide/nickel transport system substrate-binding protein|uniref:ABC transporter substrate-binding protein n=1 Tax=Agrobacterium radiobacter TaxID=362 RepID=A0ABD5LNC2_AGRRD|nr:MULTISPECIES: ABC transporter substrate-binding protein [Agrobacterium tumefaciens complex]MCP2135092.1 peptide/nickel transport system substrate-binding protein [Rhizobium sp. SLBN-94]TGE82475.1 ABC transporter substrate-binding protein [Rhizobium sp. SEMIA 439]EPR20242.1 peptide ABC transporter substrate-binding protein [Agrobacterium radiobacter DSM 30147]KAA1236613.1 ABC transporter substrate-binding protein [Agrobacterium tumefaciens]KAB0462709.1 ABC transporter substrate-binding prote